ncbi:MAG: SpoIIE family protein phosphatase, partial [Acidobacteria bacterium]|nr:SpoIIE family protein phosphatase [Acidobacteriota bacterium]
TFAYAIVRFQILDIRIILRKGLLYTATTAVVTGLYALGIASFNTWFTGTSLAASRFFPLVFALAIVLLFEPLRRRIQGPVDRFFFGEQTRLQQAMVQLGEALAAQLDLTVVVRDLVEELPRLLGLRFAALYLWRGGKLERTAGPENLPPELLPALASLVGDRRRRIQQLEALSGREVRAHGLGRLLKVLEARDVEMLADLSSPRRPLGLILLSGKNHQMAYEPEEVELLGSLLAQAAVALENSLLLEEKTLEAELGRDLAIASSIQSSLLPEEVSLGEGWEVAALCRPAKDVGGDFFAQLPGENPGRNALIYGDVSGKSVAGALVMMAAHEVLHALALTHPQPQELLDLANRRLYQLGNRTFVAIGYLAGHRENGSLLYSVAGQPSPLKRGLDGSIDELPPPRHRVPLGALGSGSYEVMTTDVLPGELILAYSDGVLDTQSPEGEFFGEDRLRQCLRAAPAAPRETVRYILDSLQTFARGQTPYDDLTLVAVRRTPEALDA